MVNGGVAAQGRAGLAQLPQVTLAGPEQNTFVAAGRPPDGAEIGHEIYC